MVGSPGTPAADAMRLPTDGPMKRKVGPVGGGVVVGGCCAVRMAAPARAAAHAEIKRMVLMMPLWRGHSIRDRDSGFGIWDSGRSWDSGLGIRALGIRARDDPLLSGLAAGGFTHFERAQETVRQFADLRRERCEFVHH